MRANAQLAGLSLIGKVRRVAAGKSKAALANELGVQAGGEGEEWGQDGFPARKHEARRPSAVSGEKSLRDFP